MRLVLGGSAAKVERARMRKVNWTKIEKAALKAHALQTLRDCHAPRTTRQRFSLSPPNGERVGVRSLNFLCAIAFECFFTILQLTDLLSLNLPPLPGPLLLWGRRGRELARR